MRVRQNHKFLVGIVPMQIRGGGACGFHQQGHGAELVHRKETGGGRARLNRERRFQLQQIEKIGLRQPARRTQPEKLRGIRTGLKQRGGRQRREGNSRRDRGEIVKQLPAQRVLQFPKIKSFASSTPIWRELSSKYRLCRSATVGEGQDVISSSSKRGDHPPQYSDRPPTV